jgi:hypothetical protein
MELILTITLPAKNKFLKRSAFPDRAQKHLSGLGHDAAELLTELD